MGERTRRMIIQHNMLAMNTLRQLGIATNTKLKKMERISSGYQLNRAADDAASLAISEKMRAQIRGLQKGSQNVQEAISFCNVGEGALNEVHDILGRVKELAVQAASDTYVLEDREAIEAEFTQLKDEINRISKTTEFNTMRIFDDGRFKVEFTDDVCPIKIFNASFGNPNSPDTYGGVIVGEDERIAWTTIDPDMVTLNPDTGETVFKAGEYKYSAAAYEFTINCEDGSKPPEIKVEFEVSANGEGIHIAGTTIFWEDVVNENDESILDHLGEEGNYHFRGRGGSGGLYVEEGAMLSDIIKELNRYNEDVHTRYYSVYNGFEKEQAVDVQDAGTYTKISQSMYDNFIKLNKTITDVEFSIRADEDAIWVEDKDGKRMDKSVKTWKDLGLEHWDSTNDVSDMKTYQYEYTNELDNSISVEFEFFLLDETSKESVIEGINKMEIFPVGTKVYNEVTSHFSSSGVLVDHVHIMENNSSLTLQEEGEFGRIFDSNSDDFAKATTLAFDATTNTLVASFESLKKTSKTMIYESADLPTVEELKKLATEQFQYQLARAVQKGVSPNGRPVYPGLGWVIGDTNSGSSTVSFEDICTTTPDMVKTSGLGTGTFAAKEVDFSGMGTSYELCDLLGFGFSLYNDKIWDNEFVQFVYGGSTNKTVNGFGYSVTEEGSVKVDLKTFMEQGISTGAEFTRALVEVFDQPGAGMDTGLVQYAADSAGRLYVCDRRSEIVGTDAVNDWHYGHQDEFIYTTDVDIVMQHVDDARNFEVSYSLDLSEELKNGLDADLVESADGMYVKNASGAIELYEESDYYDSDGNLLAGTVPVRYNIEITDTINWDSIHTTMIQDILSCTDLRFHAWDYAKLDCMPNENPNKAYVSTFRFQIEEEKDEGMWIQAGPNTYQGLFMKWDGFSSHTLGLSHLSMTDREEASVLLRRVDKATEKISGIRSAFGAYTNRLEIVYNMNKNYEENLQYAESYIRDADMATELMANAKAGILQQVAQSMLSQVTQNAEQVLSLLQ